jgi:hypothetical protein
MEAADGWARYVRERRGEGGAAAAPTRPSVASHAFQKGEKGVAERGWKIRHLRLRGPWSPGKILAWE